MNVLIALNYQREIPPFMQIELKYAQEVFDCIYYVTPSVSNGSFVANECKATMLIEVSRKKKWIVALCSCFGMLSRRFFSVFNKARKDKRLNKRLSLYIFKHKFCEKMLNKPVRRIIRRHYREDNVCLLSAWFNETAYLASVVKEHYPNVKAYSFAHAFEIDPSRNPYINDAFDDYKFLHLDKVFFISELMRKQYLDFASPTFKELAEEKSEVTYLGCVKSYSTARTSDDGIFDICSCSSIVDVKRLLLIAHALRTWNFGRIRWTHLGDGPLRFILEEEARTLCNQNPNIEVRFMGKLKNDEVHKYYASQKVDLFLNVSEREGLPVSIMEAMAYGICVMATDVGGTREIVSEDCGILLPRDISPEQLCKSMRMFYELSTEKRAVLRENARGIWSQKFNAERNVKSFLSALI